MEGQLGIKRYMRSGMAAFLAGAAIFLANVETAFAAEAPGTYLVTVTPTYRDPVTGDIEDPGNNEGIGQGMTENLCGSTGLLEVEEDGTSYLTVRYYLDQFVGDVSFEERRNGSGSWTSRSYEKMQSVSGNSGVTDIHDKYGFTDYRMEIGGLDSTFRGKAYVEPMGRSVVYFFQASNPVEGSGDFVTSLKASEETEAALPAEETAGYEEGGESGEDALSGEDTASDEGSGETKEARSGGIGADGINGSGDVDDPVTGIPEKPAAAKQGTLPDENGTARDTAAEAPAKEYHLETDFDLSAVSVKEARKLTDPVLKDAVGITAVTGDTEAGAASLGGEETNANQVIMLALLGVSAALLGWFGYGSLKKKKR